MIKKICGVDYFNIQGALTLSANYVRNSPHESGWVIEGKITGDWYEWVNEFSSHHPEYGKVWGNFEQTVFADSEEAYKNFIENHPPTEWDYWNI